LLEESRCGVERTALEGEHEIWVDFVFRKLSDICHQLPDLGPDVIRYLGNANEATIDFPYASDPILERHLGGVFNGRHFAPSGGLYRHVITL
jgi:hypothetical protein